MIVHSKLNEEGFTRFYDQDNSEKYLNECLQRVEQFCIVLVSEGNKVDVSRTRYGQWVVINLLINQEVHYQFYHNGVTFWYTVST